MKRFNAFVLALLLLSSLWPQVTVAQAPPPTLPPNSVYGRLGAGQSGPGYAIPFATLSNQLFPYFGANQRISLKATASFYVNGDPANAQTCGSTGQFNNATPGQSNSKCVAGIDTNNCLTPATACLTVQHVVNTLIRSTDFAGFNATIYPAHGSSNNYAFTCTAGPIVGQSVFNIQGDTTAPTAVTIVATSGAVVVKDLCTVSIDSVAMADNGSNNAQVFVSVGTGAPGHVDLSNITFGALGIGTALQASYSGATITLNGTNFITGSENAFIASTNGGTIDVSGGTTTLSGTPAFATAFAYITNGGSIVTNGSNFIGSATGPKCFVVGSLETSGVDPNSFPGNSNCIANNYIGQTINTQNISPTTSLTLNSLGNGTKVVGADGINTGYVAAIFGAVGTNNFARFDGTQASPSALLSGEEIGRLAFSGATSSSALAPNKARINCFAAENWGPTATGTYCDIWTDAKTTTTAQSNFRFQASGGLSVGNANIATDGGAGVEVNTATLHAGVTFANLPSAVAGTTVYMTDGKNSNCGDTTCTTWGTTVTGGAGSLKLLVWYNGANWTLVGK